MAEDKRICGHCGQAIPQTFGQRLKRARQDRGLTQPEFAKLAGILDGNLSRYELDKSTPQMKTAVKLAGALGLSVDWLLGLNGERTQS